MSAFENVVGVVVVFFFKQKTAYEMRISDWSSDVCSSDLRCPRSVRRAPRGVGDRNRPSGGCGDVAGDQRPGGRRRRRRDDPGALRADQARDGLRRSEEHTSELQSLMRTSYAVYCLRNKIYQKNHVHANTQHARLTK